MTAWNRTAGAFAIATPANGADGVATVGTVGHECDCCGKKYLVVAAVTPEGAEISVALPIPAAIEMLSAASEQVRLIVSADATLQ